MDQCSFTGYFYLSLLPSLLDRGCKADEVTGVKPHTCANIEISFALYCAPLSDATSLGIPRMDGKGFGYTLRCRMK